MSLDHDAIYKAYPNVVTIDDDTGAYDESGSIVNLDLSNIAAARVELDKDGQAPSKPKTATAIASNLSLTVSVL